MEIYTRLIDSREKRWFRKVAKAAENAVNDLIRPIGGDEQLEIHAHFDTREPSRVQIVDCRAETATYTQVIFAAKNWLALTEAVPSATAQLLSATMALAPAEVRPQLGDLLSEDRTLVAVHRSGEQLQGDGLTDFYLYVDESMTVDAFFALIDRIDEALAQRDAGQVSGNAYRLDATGSCIDLVGIERRKTQEIADEEMRASGIRRYRFEP